MLVRGPGHAAQRPSPAAEGRVGVAKPVTEPAPAVWAIRLGVASMPGGAVVPAAEAVGDSQCAPGSLRSIRF